MNNWVEAIAELERKGQPYVLITLVGAQGSVPRDSGTKMVVGRDRIWGTIGGGHLEYQSIAIACEMLRSGEAEQKVEHFPLGARLGQCCGGRASVLFEAFPGSDLNIMLFGAGHVGRSLAAILAQLPCRLHWVDSRENEFPEQLPANVIKVHSDSPGDEVTTMPAAGYYIVMTHEHPLDFAITEAVLKRGDAHYVGLIGSDTKWQRFKMRFQHRGYSEEFYRPVHCPIGLAQVPGKRPVEVAVAVAGEIIAEYQKTAAKRPNRQGVPWRELKELDIAGGNADD